MNRDSMSSRERWEALVRGEELDRVPCLQFILGHTAVVSGRPIAKIYDEARTSIACQRDAMEMYGYDGLILHGWANAGGTEFGGEVEYPYRQYTGAPMMKKNPVQSEQDAWDLRVPDDIARVGTIPVSLEFSRLQSELGMPCTVHVGSPLTWAGSVMGEDRMMMWMLKKPDLVHRVLEKVSEFVVKVAEHYASEFGAANLMAFHGAATESNKLISPKQFETFVLPYYRQVNERVIGLGVSSMFIHICGEQNRNLEYWQQVPLPEHTILSVGREVSLRTAMEVFPGQIIAGNVDPTLIQEGRPEDVLEQARECIETAKHHEGGYVLMAGCDVPPLAPPVNVFQLVKAAREFGRY